jgi:hypothetical protein
VLQSNNGSVCRHARVGSRGNPMYVKAEPRVLLI